MDYEVVIGLETHSELLTDGKLWCRCGTKFGQEPNTQTCPVCLGMPGSLPVLNRLGFELALRAAVALGCRINRTCCFDRKNYYYPDLPKNYQISQDYLNLGIGGALETWVDGEPRSVRIHNVHLEEDAGKNLHADGSDSSLVDLNRAGTPLLEIVSQPDMRSVAEALAYMQALRQLLLYTEVSDCKMQEGSLRFEASISLRPFGQEELGARVEVKNLNSMKGVCGAMEYEMRRQAKLLDSGGAVQLETRLWDVDRNRTARMRSKEEAQDYRYFPDPDLLPIVVDDEMLERVTSYVPELPLARRARFAEQFGLTAYEAQVLTDLKATADYFEECLAVLDAPTPLAKWIMNEVMRELKERDVALGEFEVEPARLAGLVALLDAGRINPQAARDVMTRMMESPQDAEAIVAELGLEQISDTGELDAFIAQVIEENPQPVEHYLNGKKAAVGALVGQVMKLSRGKADPKLVSQMLRDRLDAMAE
jgi:aspartyl-tRNA(Asn)/glutamyl-tRNA(Gln) amidotransferase subunit B